MDVLAGENLLRSWKEISAYLGCDARTCYRWEKRLGMPVHRADEGAAKSRVFAYKDELDAWFRSTFTNSHPPGPPRTGPRPYIRWLLAGFVPIAAAALFMIGKPGTLRSGQPVDFHIRGTNLIILGENGKELWRKDLKIEGLESEETYRTCFQTSTSGDSRLPWLIIKDIDGDGRNEVLFAVKTREDRYGEGGLFCFDGKGKELWRFAAGRKMSFGGRTYSPDYRIHGLALDDFNGDGRQEIAVVSFQYPQWPCQLALLDCRGRMIGEFWNSGQVKDIAFQDLDGDGRDEMIAGGVNNQYGPFVAVFDPNHVEGCSPQSGEFRSDTLPPGSEKYYLIFPRTDVSLARGDIVEGVRDMGITGDKRIMVDTEYNLFFYFGFDLRCLSVDWGHGFMRKHNELVAEGKIRSDLSDPYRETMKKKIRYWDGSRFVSEPMPDLSNASAGGLRPALNNRR
jgi:hypothetical protein